MNRISRRRMLKLGAVAALAGIAGRRTAFAQHAPVAPVESPTQTAKPLAEAMADAANAFLNGLDADQRARATYDFAARERFRWHWTTPAGFPRNGLPLTLMRQAQRPAAFDLLRASTSEYGYKKAVDIVSLQNDLNQDPDLLYFTVFGTPEKGGTWGWRMEGHHLSRQFTVVGEKVFMTPFFLGARPTETAKGLIAMPREEQAARELVTSLNDTDKGQVIFNARSLTNLVTGNRDRVPTPPEAVGMRYSALGTGQQKLIDEIIATYLANFPAEIEKAALDRIKAAGVGEITFGWAGVLEPRKPHYYRLQGPTFLLEFDNSRNSGTHIHSVWRDYELDFGGV